MNYNQKLSEIIENIITQMKVAGYSDGTCGRYQTVFNRLLKLAKSKGEVLYSNDLGQEFIADDAHIVASNTERYHHERTLMYRRCIRLIESYLRDGQADFTPVLSSAEFPLSSVQ